MFNIMIMITVLMPIIIIIITITIIIIIIYTLGRYIPRDLRRKRWKKKTKNRYDTQSAQFIAGKLLWNNNIIMKTRISV